jgi:hypothetical protein
MVFDSSFGEPNVVSLRIAALSIGHNRKRRSCTNRGCGEILRGLGINALRLPLLGLVTLDPVRSILSLFLFDTDFALLALLATVGHGPSPS